MRVFDTKTKSQIVFLYRKLKGYVEILHILTQKLLC